MTTNKYKILFMFALCSFLAPFINSSLNLALPLIGKQFGMHLVAMGWVATVFFLSTAVFLLPMGRLADIVGRKKIFMNGTIIFTLATFICGLSNSGLFLILARAVQGLGYAMIFGTTMTILVSIFPPQERGYALGINIAGIYLGNSFGPVLGSFISQQLGWPFVFFLAALLGVFVIFMSRIYLKPGHDHRHADGEKFDIRGSLLYAIAVISMLYGTTLLPHATGFIVAGSGIIALITFFFVEKITTHPVFDINLLLKNRRFAFSNLAAILNFTASFAVPFLMSLYLQYAHELSPQKAGLLLLIAAATIALFSPLSGRLADRHDARIIASFGLTLAATSLLILSIILCTNTSLSVITMLLFFFGTGLGFFASPNSHAAMESVSVRHVGQASSLLSTMRSFGQTMSMGISMLIFSLIIGKVSISCDVVPQLIQSIRIIFFIFSALFIGAVAASYAQGKGYRLGEEKI